MTADQMPDVRTATYRLLRRHGRTTIFGNPGLNELPFLAGMPADCRCALNRTKVWWPPWLTATPSNPPANLRESALGLWHWKCDGPLPMTGTRTLRW